MFCNKIQIEAEVPWEKQPSMETQSQQLATKDHDFTEQYLKSEHGELIEGINNLYNTFIAMGYFDSSELRFPPHLDLDVDTLASIGLEAEAIALLRYLPYADSKVEISTWTMPYNYLEDCQDAREVRWDGLHDLAPWVIRLTRVQKDDGRTLIYDLRTKAIIQWCINDGYTNSYLELPAVSPAKLFGRWIEYLKELKEIPWRRGNSRMITSKYQMLPFSYLCLSEEESPVPENPDQYDRDQLNEYLAMKRLFVSCGWPEDFSKEEFELKRKEWQARYDDLDKVGGISFSTFLYETAGDGALALTASG